MATQYQKAAAPPGRSGSLLCNQSHPFDDHHEDNHDNDGRLPQRRMHCNQLLCRHLCEPGNHKKSSPYLTSKLTLTVNADNEYMRVVLYIMHNLSKVMVIKMIIKKHEIVVGMIIKILNKVTMMMITKRQRFAQWSRDDDGKLVESIDPSLSCREEMLGT